MLELNNQLSASSNAQQLINGLNSSTSQFNLTEEIYNNNKNSIITATDSLFVDNQLPTTTTTATTTATTNTTTSTTKQTKSNLIEDFLQKAFYPTVTTINGGEQCGKKISPKITCQTGQQQQNNCNSISSIIQSINSRSISTKTTTGELTTNKKTTFNAKRQAPVRV